MRIVLDTNVLVSGLLNPFGAPGELVRLVASGALELCYDARILCEYRDVLLRRRFPFDPDYVNGLLETIEAEGGPVSGRPLAEDLPDPTDAPFLEAALAGEARCIVTGNVRHYPLRAREGMVVVSPAEFLGIYRREALRPPAG
ncbi:MAG: putative toxin-antitoxin system toxin component, PIN family [Deltaproteobacteria bacterium]|nr:putative toxin-antitoxin system toxin component, PIN family [Deltaproteobacteria bacterium]